MEGLPGLREGASSIKQLVWCCVGGTKRELAAVGHLLGTNLFLGLPGSLAGESRVSDPLCRHPDRRGQDRPEVGGIGQHRKCLLGLKIVWEGIGNRNFGPTWKCFLSDQEMGTGAVRVATTLLHGRRPPTAPSLCVWLGEGKAPSHLPLALFLPGTVVPC